MFCDRPDPDLADLADEPCRRPCRGRRSAPRTPGWRGPRPAGGGRSGPSGSWSSAEQAARRCRWSRSGRRPAGTWPRRYGSSRPAPASRSVTPRTARTAGWSSHASLHARQHEHELQHGGHEERVGHAVGLDGVDHLGRVHLAQQHARHPGRHAGQRPAAAADVEQRHGDEVHRVGAAAPSRPGTSARRRRGCGW